MPDTSSTRQAPNPPAPALASLAIDRRGGARRRRRRWPWVAAALLLAAAAVAALMPRKAEVQATTVQTAYPSQQYTVLSASG